MPKYLREEESTRERSASQRRLLPTITTYYGGNVDDADDSYQVKGVPGLYVSEGGVLRRLTPGPSSATIMQIGMRVVDAFVASLDNDIDDDDDDNNNNVT